MTQYSPSALLERIMETLYTNNMNEIDALDMRQLMIDFLDSMQFKGSTSGGGGVSTYYISINNTNLDEDKKIIIPHSLSTFTPFTIIINHMGELINEIHFTAKTTDENNVELQFEDDIPAGQSYKVLIIKFIADTSQPPQSLEVFREDFEEWYGEGWETLPVGWQYTSDSITRDENNRIYEDNDAGKFLIDTSGNDGLTIYSNFPLIKNAQYKVQIRYKSNQDNILLIGGVNPLPGQGGTYGGKNLPSTNGEWVTDYIQLFIIPKDGMYFALRIQLFGVPDINITIDWVSLELI